MTTTLRVLTLNLWNRSGDVRRRMEVALAGVKAIQPDVIGLQEVVENPAPGGLRQATAFARAIGGEARFAVADADSPVGPIGNAIVSRLPMGQLRVARLPAPPRDKRVMAATRLDTPAGPVTFINTHLSWELNFAPVREQQVVALDAFARAHASALPTVMTGDFNAAPDSDAIRFLTGRASLDGVGTYWRDAFARLHPHADGYTWSAANPLVARHVERNRRIDYVFVGPLAEEDRGVIVDARVVLDVPAPDGTFASDHFGVLVQIDLGPPR